MPSSNPTTNHKVINNNLRLLGLIHTQNWKSFQSVALANPKIFKFISASLSQCPEFNGMTLLHACARFNPPVEMIAKMIDICPEMASAVDCIGRTPLHVATGSGTNLALIQLLARRCPKACDMQDEDGKTPLHLACDSECELFEDDEAVPRGPPSYDVVRCLLKGSTNAAMIEDEDGMNALEYAICSDASPKLVQLLQAVTQKAIIRRNSSEEIRRKSSNEGRNSNEGRVPGRSTNYICASA